jgi:hypothetical protein
MAKAIPLSADDLNPIAKPSRAAMRQRGEVPSVDLIPLQFRMPPEFVKGFKQAALDGGMKLNELLRECFDAYLKQNNIS